MGEKSARQDAQSQNPDNSPTTPAIDLTLAHELHEEADLVMDKGAVAWLQVFGSFLLYANTWGIITSFGVFQAYYTNTLTDVNSPSSIVWIGSVQFFLTELIGAFVGYFIDAGYLTHILVLGTFLEVFGIMMLSLCRTYWQILLAQAFTTGLGIGLLGLTAVAITPLYFRKKRSLVLGMGATGNSLAGIVYPLMMRRLLDIVGFAWAVRCLGFVVLACLLLCLVTLRDRPQLRQSRTRTPLIDLKYLRDAPYMFFSLGCCLAMAAFFGPLFFISDYGLRLGLSPNLSTSLISIINATSILGRLIPGYLGDKLGCLNVLLPSVFSTAIVIFFFRLASNTVGLVLICAIYGFISGSIMAIYPSVVADFSEDIGEYATRMGMVVTMESVFGLVGYPISGAIQRPNMDARLEFQGTWYFGGGVMLAAGVAMAAAKHLKYGLLSREIH